MSLGCNPQGSKAAQSDQNTVLSSAPVSSSSPPLFSPLFLIWSGIHSLQFAILMKIRHLPCQPSPLSADPCHNNREEKRERRKRQGEKQVRQRRVGESPYQKRDIMLLVDWIVRWPIERRKKWSLSFWVARTEVFSHGGRITIWCWLSD